MRAPDVSGFTQLTRLLNGNGTTLALELALAVCGHGRAGPGAALGNARPVLSNMEFCIFAS